MLIVPEKIGRRSHYSGIDSLKSCVDLQHFLNYSKKITYEYNSRGFRDTEWPEDLSEVIWCVGDSFTMGLGQPYEETWPYLLEKRIRKRCINLGEDGCSNDTIALRAQEIYKLYKPKIMVVMWSYLHRRRINNENVHFDKKDFGLEKDLENFKKNFIEVNTLDCKILNLLIPNILALNTNSKNFELPKYIFKKKLCLKKDDLKKINCIPQLDYARDYHHFDAMTSEHLVNLLIKKINEFDF
jgi:hypothetical protein